jgi:predicted nucleic acid-binding protein
MYLIDTSVWLSFLRGDQTPAVAYFDTILTQGLPYGLTGVIYQEIIQGASTQKEFDLLVSYLSTQHFYEPQESVATYEKAAYLYYRCRKKGLTIRSTIDCLIAQIAIEHQLIVVHQDQDFNRIAQASTDLILFKL